VPWPILAFFAGGIQGENELKVEVNGNGGNVSR
jgi:hypothetical protein